MKKFMLLLIAIIPLMLLVTIEFAIVTIKDSYYITVEKVEFPAVYQEVQKTSSDSVTISFAAQVTPFEATDKSIRYYSSNPLVASVDDKGNISFLDFGEVEIFAQSISNIAIAAKCKFYVTDTKVHRIELLDYVTSLNVGDSFVLSSSVVPKEALDKTLEYHSSNSGVATVSPSGKITAVSKGYTTISIISNNGVTTSFDLEVIVPVASITIDENNKSLVSGVASLSFPEFEILPLNATNQSVYYVSSNEKVATISPSGDITFNMPGTCEFKVYTVDGNYYDTFEVLYTAGYIVSASIQESSLVITQEYTTNGFINIGINIYPANASISNILYSSSNPNVIFVNSDNTLSITGGGNAEIRVSIKKSSSEVVDIGRVSVYISRPCESITLDSNMVETTTPDYKIEYTCLPLDHTDSITFESSASNIATVSDSGIVSFKGFGVVDIIIRANMSVSSTLQVTYNSQGVKLITINNINESIECYYGETIAFSFVQDLGIDLSNVSYTVMGESLSYVSLNKIFYATLGGTSIVTASSGLNNVTISVSVIRYALDIEYQFDTLQTTSKKEVCFTSNVLPLDATNRVINYSVSDALVATISNTGVLTFSKAGTITVYMRVDSIEKSVVITSTFGTVTDFSLAYKNKVLPDINETLTIRAEDFSFTPKDYVFDENKVQVSIQNTSVASATNNVILALAKGSTKVYVTIDTVQKEFNLEVQVKTTSISFTHQGKDIDYGRIIGNSIELEYTISPSNANNKSVQFTMLDGNATLDSVNGVLTFNNVADYATIKVTTLDSGVYDTITIYKLENPDALEIYQQNIKVTDLDYFSSPNLKVLPSLGYAVLELRVEDVLDPDNFNFDLVTYSFSDTNTCVEYLGFGQYKVFNSNNNRSIADTISFLYNTVQNSVTMKFYKLESINLALDNADDASFGLEQKRVFGICSYFGAEVNTLPIEYTLSENGKEDQLYWFVSSLDKETLGWIVPSFNYDTDFFSVHKDQTTGQYFILSNTVAIDYFFATLDSFMSNGYMAVVDLELKIKITVGNESDLQHCTVTDEYIYHFVSGVNVYDADGFNYTNARNKVLHTNLVAYAGEVSGDNYVLFQPTLVDIGGKRVVAPLIGDARYNFENCIYGNGYLINFNGITESPSADYLPVYMHFTNVHIRLQSNGNISSYKYHLAIYNGITIGFSIIENMTNTYVGQNAAFTAFRNCVIRNANKTGIHISKESEADNFMLYVENCVFANVGQCAITAQNGNVYIRGFFDVYNFISYSGFGEYATIAKELLESPEYADFVYNDGAEPVANIAIAAPPTSYTSTSSPKVNNVYFLNPSTGAYETNVDTCTGQNYTRLTQSKTFNFVIYKYTLTAHLWAPRKNDRITPNSPVDISRVYRLYA
ncbi:MAG: Ig-like domain-containing protein [Clostridia bacterium]|nr:Ig-like domain-containing protein [Clostridia bacterium]